MTRTARSGIAAGNGELRADRAAADQRRGTIYMTPVHEKAAISRPLSSFVRGYMPGKHGPILETASHRPGIGRGKARTLGFHCFGLQPCSLGSSLGASAERPACSWPLGGRPERCQPQRLAVSAVFESLRQNRAGISLFRTLRNPRTLSSRHGHTSGIPMLKVWALSSVARSLDFRLHRNHRSFGYPPSDRFAITAPTRHPVSLIRMQPWS